MSRLIVRDRRLCVLDRKLIRDSGDGAPCVCGGDPDPGELSCTDPEPVCLSVAVDGIAPNDQGFVGTWFGIGVCEGAGRGVPTALGGVNGEFFIDRLAPPEDAPGEFPCTIPFQYTPTDPGLAAFCVAEAEANPFAHNRMVISVGLGCNAATDLQGVSSVRITCFHGPFVVDTTPDLLFEFSVADPFTQAVPFGIPVPNQIDPLTPVNNPGLRKLGVGGTVTVSPSAVCSGTPLAIMEECENTTNRIVVDLGTNTTAAGLAEDDAGNLYRPTSLPGTPPAIDVSWVPGLCEGTRIAVSCVDGTEIGYDPEQATPGAVACEFEGDRYTLTDQTTGLPAENITIWLTEGCPDQYEAVRCASLGFALFLPPVCAYTPSPGIGVGNGDVQLTGVSPGDPNCNFQASYRPTTTPAGAGLQTGRHLNRQACSRPFFLSCISNEGEFYQDPCDRPNPPPEICNRSTDAITPPSIASRVVSLTQSIASGRRADEDVIERRQRSCFGDEAEGVPECPLLKRTARGAFCGGCGCGQRKMARLDPDPRTGKHKLQFTRLSCPLGRDGFG